MNKKIPKIFSPIHYEGIEDIFVLIVCPLQHSSMNIDHF